MTDREPGVIAKIRAVDEALARRDMSPVASERVRQTLARHAQARALRARLRWWPALAFAAGAALMAVLLLERREAGERGAVARREAEVPTASPEVVPPPEPRCEPLDTGALRLESDGCLAGDGVRVSAWAPATLARAGDRVTVQDGEVMFEVEPRPGTSAARARGGDRHRGGRHALHRPPARRGREGLAARGSPARARSRRLGGRAGGG
ncbi:hypothetical protein [Nannocystis pusilla]|uniref:hypothetical protein n=1 Tax=Nannocystis pusilla TaxID=889268 RepID=UPI003DA43BFD